MTNNVKMVSLEALTPNPNNFYKSSDKDKEAMAASIREDGLKVPITAMPDPAKPDRYIIISGHLRAWGCQMAGLKEVRVIIEEYDSEEDQLNALLLGNEYRTKTKREVANEMSMRKRIWSKKQGERSDLYSKEGEVLKTTRARLAERYRMAEATVGKYETILDKRPSLFEQIDNDQMSIDGAFNLIKYLDENELSELEGMEMWSEVVARVSPHLLKKVNENKMPLELAFYAVVRSISKLKRPKARKESEESDSELSPVEKAVTPEKSATPKKKAKDSKASLTTHRCEVPECPCYEKTVQVIEEEKVNETQSAE